MHICRLQWSWYAIFVFYAINMLTVTNAYHIGLLEGRFLKEQNNVIAGSNPTRAMMWRRFLHVLGLCNNLTTLKTIPAVVNRISFRINSYSEEPRGHITCKTKDLKRHRQGQLPNQWRFNHICLHSKWGSLNSRMWGMSFNYKRFIKYTSLLVYFIFIDLMITFPCCISSQSFHRI